MKFIAIYIPYGTVAAAALLLVGGCARSFEFRAVDANSGLPLRGVAVDRYSTQDDVFLGSKRSREQLPSTDSAGMTRARGLPSNWIHYFSFQKPGYAEAEVAWEPDRFLLLSPADSQKEFQPVQSTRIVEVPMYGRGAK